MAENKSNAPRNITSTVWQLDRHPHYELFFRFAEGFINASITVIEKQLSGPHKDFFECIPAHFALEHGIELFLKGAILLGDSSITVHELSSMRYGHTLDSLYMKYQSIYIGDKYKISNRINEIIDWRMDMHDPRGLASRFPFDKIGTMYGPKNLSIDWELHLVIFKEISSDLMRLEQELKRIFNLSVLPIEQSHFPSEQ